MGGITKWLQPPKWEIVDRELCNLMDRLDDGVKLEVVFADGALSGRGEPECAGYERADRMHPMLLNGVKARGGIVKVQNAETDLVLSF